MGGSKLGIWCRREPLKTWGGDRTRRRKRRQSRSFSHLHGGCMITASLTQTSPQMRREWENVILASGFWLTPCRVSFWAVAMSVSPPLQRTGVSWGKATGRRRRALCVPEKPGRWDFRTQRWHQGHCERGFRDRVWGQQPSSVWAELYWVSVPPPRHGAMFSRPCSMALLPTQVCVWWRPAGLCARPRQWNLCLERNPAGKCAVLGECVPGKAWGAPVPSCLVAPGTGDARQYILPAGWPVASVSENQTREDYKPKRASPQNPQPPPSPESSPWWCREGSHWVENLLNIFIWLSLLSLPANVCEGSRNSFK